MQWDSVAKSEIQEKKIRVTFLPADDSKATAAAATPVRQTHTNGVSNHGQAKSELVVLTAMCTGRGDSRGAAPSVLVSSRG